MYPVFQFILCSVCDQLARSSRDFALAPEDLRRIYEKLLQFWLYTACPFIARFAITSVLLFSDLRFFFMSIRLPRPVLWAAPFFQRLKSYLPDVLLILGGASVMTWLWTLLWT